MATVNGFDPAVSGQQPLDGSGNPLPVGVWGDSSSGVGVFGSAGQTSTMHPLLIGVKGGVVGHGGEPAPDEDPLNGAHPGVVGYSTSGCGVAAFSNSGTGLYAVTTNGDTDPAVAAITAYAGNVGVGVIASCADGEGVVGQSNTVGTGVRGTTLLGTGVLGEGFADKFNGSPIGVAGISDKGIGVRGESLTDNGVFGVTFGDGSGLSGIHFSTDPGSGVSGVSVLGNGVDGFTFSTDRSVAAVRGQASRGGLAGLFVGDVRVTGRVFKGGGGFHIDHPLDPEHKTLTHSFVESPEMMNVYSGTVITDGDGKARVRLPDYFEALNGDVRYQLTTVGSFARTMVSEEVDGNEFGIASDAPNVTVCWQVTGVRRDRWAERHRIEVEQDKDEAERGGYLHPDAFESAKASSHGAHPAVAKAVPEELRASAADALSGAVEQSRFGAVVSDARDRLLQRAGAGYGRTANW